MGARHVVWGLAEAGFLHPFKGWPVAALVRHGKGRARQEAVKEAREVAVGSSKAGLLLGASPVPAGRSVQPGWPCCFFGKRGKAARLRRVRVVPEPLVSLGRRTEGRLEARGFPVL